MPAITTNSKLFKSCAPRKKSSRLLDGSESRSNAPNCRKTSSVESSLSLSVSVIVISAGSYKRSARNHDEGDQNISVQSLSFKLKDLLLFRPWEFLYLCAIYIYIKINLLFLKAKLNMQPSRSML